MAAAVEEREEEDDDRASVSGGCGASSSSSERLPMLATRRADDEHKEEQGPTSQGLFSDLRKHPLVAYALVSAACVIMTFAGVLVKVMTAVDPFLLAAVRNCVIFLCSMPRLIRRNIDVAPRGGGKVKFLFARAFFTALYTMSLFYSFRYMPLGDARTITSTNPVFTSIFAWFVLGEPFGLFEVLVLVSTVTGMVIVLHPPSLFEDSAAAVSAAATAYDSTYTYAAIFASVGTVFQALGVVATGAVRDVDVAVVTAWNGFLGMFPPLVATLAVGALALPSAADALLALLIGILGFFGHSLMVLALQVEDAGTVQLVRKADDILLAFLIQILYFRQYPDLAAAMGAVIIVVSVVVSGVRKLIDKNSENECVRQMFCLKRRSGYDQCDHVQRCGICP